MPVFLFVGIMENQCDELLLGSRLRYACGKWVSVDCSSMIAIAYIILFVPNIVRVLEY